MGPKSGKVGAGNGGASTSPVAQPGMAELVAAAQANQATSEKVLTILEKMATNQANQPMPATTNPEMATIKWIIAGAGVLISVLFGFAVFFIQREMAKNDEANKEIRNAITELKIGLENIKVVDKKYEQAQKSNDDNFRRNEDSIKDINRRLEMRPVITATPAR